MTTSTIAAELAGILDAWGDGGCNLTSTQELELALVLNETVFSGDAEAVLAIIGAVPACAELQEPAAVRALVEAVASLAAMIGASTPAAVATAAVQGALKVGLAAGGALSPSSALQLTGVVRAALGISVFDPSDLSAGSLASASLSALGSIRAGTDTSSASTVRGVRRARRVASSTVAAAAAGSSAEALLSAELMDLARVLGRRLACALSPNETAELRAGTVDLGLVSLPLVDGASSDVQEGEMSMEGGELTEDNFSEPSARLASEASGQAEDCQSITLQKTLWLASNPYFWAQEGNLQVATDANVTTLDIWHCGQQASFKDPAPRCRIRLAVPPAHAAPPDGGDVVGPTCVRFDEASGAWSDLGVATEYSLGDAVVVCVSSTCSGAFTLALKSSSVASTTSSVHSLLASEEDESSASSSAQTFIISASLLLGGVLSSMACYAAWVRRAPADIEEGMASLPSLLPVLPTKESDLTLAEAAATAKWGGGSSPDAAASANALDPAEPISSASICFVDSEAVTTEHVALDGLHDLAVAEAVGDAFASSEHVVAEDVYSAGAAASKGTRRAEPIVVSDAVTGLTSTGSSAALVRTASASALAAAKEAIRLHHVDTTVTICPYFKIEASDLPLWKAKCDAFYEVAKKEDGLLFYGFGFEEAEGDCEVHVHQSFRDAATLVAHLRAIDVPIQAAIKLSSLERVEVYGPAAELRKVEAEQKDLCQAKFEFFERDSDDLHLGSPRFAHQCRGPGTVVPPCQAFNTTDVEHMQADTPRSPCHISIAIDIFDDSPAAAAAAVAPGRQNERATLIRSVFEKLDVNGNGTLAATELRRLADEVGFNGDDVAWTSEYLLLCEYLGCSANVGVDVLSFARLVDDESEQGCFCANEELRALLELPDLAPSSPSICSNPEEPPEPSSGLHSIPVSAASSLGPLFEAGCLQLEQTPKFGCDDLECGIVAGGTPEVGTARRVLIADVFLKLDVDGDVHLSTVELRPLADYVGFEGSPELWVEEFGHLCRHLGCDSGMGLDLQAFSRLVNDRSKQGCFCTDADLCQLLANLGDGHDDSRDPFRPSGVYSL